MTLVNHCGQYTFEANVTALRSPYSYSMGRPSVVCDLCALLRGLNFSSLFLHDLIAQRLGQFVLKYWKKFQSV